MKKVFKSIIALLLVFTFLFCGTSCRHEEAPDIQFDNPFEGKTYAEIMDSATEIKEDMIRSTANNNTFEIKSVKSKIIVFSGLAATVSLVTFLISMAFGGIYTIPGIYTADKGERILELKIEYANNSSESVMIGDVIHSVFAIANDNVYNGLLCHTSSMNLDFSCTEIIDPGESETFSILIDVPKEYVNDHSLFDVYFDVEGTVYSLSYIK